MPKIKTLSKPCRWWNVNRQLVKACISLTFIGFLSGCATGSNPIDPMEPFNRDVHEFNLKADKYVLKPVAKGYDWITPDFVDTGVTNFFGNLQGVRVTFNDLLQLKFQEAGFDMLRFVVNSSVGLGGLFDVASALDIPKRDEDFAQTLGYWGVPSGPFLVVPFLGPSSPRSIGGSIGDAPLNPISYIGLYPVSMGLQTLNLVDKRSDFLALDDVLEEISDYALMRDAYMQRQTFVINDGEITQEFDDEDFYDESDEVLDIN
jgi:phospholipid-binding lipoprotein MlaA